MNFFLGFIVFFSYAENSCTIYTDCPKLHVTHQVFAILGDADHSLVITASISQAWKQIGEKHHREIKP